MAPSYAAADTTTASSGSKILRLTNVDVAEKALASRKSSPPPAPVASGKGKSSPSPAKPAASPSPVRKTSPPPGPSNTARTSPRAIPGVDYVANGGRKSSVSSNSSKSSNGPKAWKPKPKPTTDEDGWTMVPTVEKDDDKKSASRRLSELSDANRFDALQEKNDSPALESTAIRNKYTQAVCKPVEKVNASNHHNNNKKAPTGFNPSSAKTSSGAPAANSGKPSWANVRSSSSSSSDSGVSTKSSPKLAPKELDPQRLPTTADFPSAPQAAVNKAVERPIPVPASSSIVAGSKSWATVATASKVANPTFISPAPAPRKASPVSGSPEIPVPTTADFPMTISSSPKESTASVRSYATVTRTPSPPPAKPIPSGSSRSDEVPKIPSKDDFPATLSSTPPKQTLVPIVPYALMATSSSPPHECKPTNPTKVPSDATVQPMVPIQSKTVVKVVAVPSRGEPSHAKVKKQSSILPRLKKQMSTVVEQKVDDLLEMSRPHRQFLLKGPQITIYIGDKRISAVAKRAAMAASPVLNKHFTENPESLECRFESDLMDPFAARVLLVNWITEGSKEFETPEVTFQASFEKNLAILRAAHYLEMEQYTQSIFNCYMEYLRSELPHYSEIIAVEKNAVTDENPLWNAMVNHLTHLRYQGRIPDCKAFSAFLQKHPKLKVAMDAADAFFREQAAKERQKKEETGRRGGLAYEDVRRQRWIKGQQKKERLARQQVPTV